MATEVLDRERLINEIWRNKGRVGLVAEALGVNASTIYRYADRYATVANAIEDARVHADVLLVDIAETKLRQDVLDGKRYAILHTLNNSVEAKRRGWGPRQEVTGSEGDPIRIKVIEGPKDVR